VLGMEETGPESVIGLGKEKGRGTVPGKGTDRGIKIGLFVQKIPITKC
jgi:hypothetical protein